MPDGWVFATRTEFRTGAAPARVMAPLPPNTTTPELAKALPPRARVAGAAGAKTSDPALATDPLFVKWLLNVCVPEPPSKRAPGPTTNDPLIIQSTAGATPPVLLTATDCRVGLVAPTKTGVAPPLKTTAPVLTKPALRAIV